MAGDPVPAVTEAEARGETADIFADLRGVMGVKVVNLIWRHIATIPGALPAAWGMLRPLYASGAVEEQSRALRAALELPHLAPIPTPPAIRDILTAYDTGNGLNLLGLNALLLRLDGAAVIPAGLPPRPAPAPGPALPPLLNLDAMDAATAARVLRLNLMGASDGGAILASLYRHLAHWPDYLSAAENRLAPLAADGRLENIIETTRGLARRQAQALLRGMGPDLPPPAALAPLRAGVSAFTSHAIARMVPIGAMLYRAATP
ncbi:hypothetical protein EOD42_06495 [Rhodovarius crocodyli]|uniref:Uncharacterized protein n=1 Tax=Rhodovarius crocodyli TaxID=1979269 RepID=A0A437MIP1_9PROT|nr:hypothetical protein [Rhodovarius crocodyli]RVT97473.1 hypothetical protein EOD42_06495 [Rhodovarius crocodyli]